MTGAASPKDGEGIEDVSGIHKSLSGFFGPKFENKRKVAGMGRVFTDASQAMHKKLHEEAGLDPDEQEVQLKSLRAKVHDAAERAIGMQNGDWSGTSNFVDAALAE